MQTGTILNRELRASKGAAGPASLCWSDGLVKTMDHLENPWELKTLKLYL